MLLFLTIGAVDEDIKTKQNLTGIDGYIILRIFYALPNFPFTKSETKRDY